MRQELAATPHITADVCYNAQHSIATFAQLYYLLLGDQPVAYDYIFVYTFISIYMYICLYIYIYLYITYLTNIRNRQSQYDVV